jgi:hypothetical protein
MGLSPFSKSSYDTVEKVVYKTQPNPDPTNYKIIKYLENRGFLIVEIQYPDCTNYEGRKILLYKHCTMKDLLKQKSIDPHFSENTDYYSPIARFEPTAEGWATARALTQTYLKEIK